MSKMKKSLLIIISFVLLIVVGLTFNHYRVENGATKYLANKYSWEVSEIKEIEHKKGYIDYSLFPLDFYVNKYNPKWVYEYKGRTFNVEYTNFHFADDYQLEDIFIWCTEYLQENVDKDIVGVEVSSDIIYHSSQHRYKYMLPWNHKKIFSSSDAKAFLECEANACNGFAVFYKVNDINYYAKTSELYEGYSANDKYYEYREQKISSGSFGEYNNKIKIVLIGDNELVRTNSQSISIFKQTQISINNFYYVYSNSKLFKRD